MAAYIAKDGRGYHYLAAESLSAHQLDNETIHGPCHWWSAMPITSGKTRWGVRWATADDYRVIAYPEGGSQALVRVEMVDGPSWVVDANSEMPEFVFDILLSVAQGVK